MAEMSWRVDQGVQALRLSYAVQELPRRDRCFPLDESCEVSCRG
jgi:hypothetical protein